MIPTAKNSESLVTLVFEAGLYKNLINQLIKDFELAGLTIELNEAIHPEKLVHILSKRIEQILEQHFDLYVQLLYRVDVPEQAMQSNLIQDTREMAQKASFAILQREWQKVYFKNQFS